MPRADGTRDTGKCVRGKSSDCQTFIVKRYLSLFCNIELSFDAAAKTYFDLWHSINYIPRPRAYQSIMFSPSVPCGAELSGRPGGNITGFANFEATHRYSRTLQDAHQIA